MCEQQDLEVTVAVACLMWWGKERFN
jgi:hypothetical protein